MPNRRGTDNAIIVQELIHTISKAKCKEWYMAIKIDLEKAYDKLEWSFIRATLMRINLPQDLIKLIMSWLPLYLLLFCLIGELWRVFILLEVLDKVTLYLLISLLFVWILKSTN